MADKRISQLVERTDIANNDVLPIVASGATTTNKVTISTIQDWMQENLDVGVTSVGLSMPSAFTVSNSPVTTSGNISVIGAGTVSQYIRGDGSLADFPQSSGGGGASVSYYLNGSVSQGTIGGVAYLEMSKSPILGAGTNFTINANGYIASFITDAGDPSLLLIPGGNWNFETYFAASSGGGTPSFYVELYKVNSSGTATLIASNSSNPELIAFGTSTTAYFSSLAVPTTTLTLTDRLALRYYVTHAGRTITLHTENSNLCQIITTFTTGLTALNGLTAQVQNFATGTSGSDFNISSASSTHTFNLPTATSTIRGALSSADWITFNAKQDAGNYVTTDTTQTITGLKTFSGSSLRLAANGTADAVVLRNVSGTTGSDTGATTMGFNGSDNIFVNTQSRGGFILGFNNSVANREYTLPDASGTIALTSNLSAYLPLTGGTLTGALGGTSLNFSGDVQSGTRLIAAASSQSIILTPNLGGTTNRVESVGTLPLALVSAAAITMAAGGTTPQITLATTGAVTLTGALNGTSALFTGDVATATRVATDTINGYTGGSTPLTIQTGGAQSVILGTNGTARLTLASTGAATFSSSVTAGGNAATTPSLIANNPSGAGGTAQHYIDFTSGATVLGRISRGNGASGLVANGLNIDNFEGCQIRLNQLGGSGGSFNVLGGNVGIGTASPAYPLDVNGSTNVSSTNFYRYNGDTGIFGSASAITGGSATQLGIRAASDILFATNGATERMRITSSGNVGIGTTSPAQLLHVKNDQAAYTWGRIDNQSTSSSAYSGLQLGASGNTWGIAIGSSAANSNALTFVIDAGGGNTERMRITSGGNVLVNTTDLPSATSRGFGIGVDSNGTYIQNRVNTTASYGQMAFLNPNGVVGQITTSGSSTSYVTSSDYRLKENIKPVVNALSKLNELKPCLFNFIADADEEVMGFIAHEVQDVIPQAVTGEKDGFRIEEVEVSPAELDEEGNVITDAVIEEKEIPIYQGIDHSKLVPLLVAAIQELKTEIDSLKNQIK